MTRNTNNTNRMIAGRITAIGLATMLTVATAAGQLLADDHNHDHDHRGCYNGQQVSIMFDPNAADADVEAAIDAIPTFIQPFFVPQGSFWAFTATDGAVSPDEPFTLTYSFIPDGVDISSITDGNTLESNLFATMNAEFPGGMDAFRQKFAAALEHWSRITNISYVEVADDGSDFGPSFFGIPAGVAANGTQIVGRGDIRVAMRPLNGTVLAVNHYPQFGGDMVMNSNKMSTFTNASNNFRSLTNTIVHEHGHGLGIKHVEGVSAVMNPFLNTAIDGPQEDDIRAVQFIYGDAYESNEGSGDEYRTGVTLRAQQQGEVTTVIEDAALTDATDRDFYSFGAFSQVPIAIKVEPVGTTYTFGPQATDANPNPQFTTVDASAVRDLGLRLWRRVSQATGELQMISQIDFNDAGEAEYHPPVPYLVAGYMLAEVYSNDGVNDVQRYRLTISNMAINASVENGGGAPTPDNDPTPDNNGADPLMQVALGLNLIEQGEMILNQDNGEQITAEVGGTTGIALTIRNYGDGPLNFTGNPNRVIVSGPDAGDFTAELGVASIAANPNAFAVLGIGCTPSESGFRFATFTIPNNDPTRPNFQFTVQVVAEEAQAPELVVALNGQTLNPNNSVNYGDVTLGDTATVELTVTNEGNAPLNVINTTLVGPAAGDYNFTLANNVLNPQQSALLTVSVTPAAEGVRIASVRLFSNAVPSPFSLILRTTGVAPIVDCNGNGVDDAQDLADGTATDCNGNNVPDACETDFDNDGVIDDCDNCPNTPNADQTDADDNGIGDVCDVIVDDENEDNNKDEDEDKDKEIVPPLGTANGCGAGVAGLAPMMIAGLCGMRRGRRKYGL